MLAQNWRQLVTSGSQSGNSGMDTFYINLVLRLWEQKAKGYGLEVKPLSCRGASEHALGGLS